MPPAAKSIGAGGASVSWTGQKKNVVRIFNLFIEQDEELSKRAEKTWDALPEEALCGPDVYERFAYYMLNVYEPDQRKGEEHLDHAQLPLHRHPLGVRQIQGRRLGCDQALLRLPGHQLYLSTLKVAARREGEHRARALRARRRRRQEARQEREYAARPCTLLQAGVTRSPDPNPNPDTNSNVRPPSLTPSPYVTLVRLLRASLQW
jgi:hypothetical protein